MSDQIPENEQKIYEKLTGIRQELSTLKRDRRNFIKSADVSAIYNRVLKQLNKLEISRKAHDGDLEAKAPNRVDYLIDDIFQLLSLCYMTVGLTQTAPATYASLSTVQRLLEHLDESGVYTNLELQPIKERLDKFAQIINEGEELEKEQEEDGEVEEELKIAKKDEYKLLTDKLDKCYAKFQTLVDKISKFSKELQAVLSQLVSIRRNLMNLITRDETNNHEELQKFKNELKALESSDNFTSVTKDLKQDEGGTLLNGLIDDCHTLISDLTVSKIESQIDPSLLPLYNQLIKIKVTLEDLLVTRRWTLRETDLFNYQKLLQEIDNNREKGLFVSKPGTPPPQKGQSILLYILRRCYAIIYKLLESSEPISEALQPIHNQLSTVRRCLLDVKRMGGISSIRELYPYQLKLASIDNLREDGKFMYEDQIPEGQGTLNALLAECFDIVHELKIEYYENEAAEEEEESSNHSGEFETTKSNLGRSDSYDDDDDETSVRDNTIGDDDDDEEEEEDSLRLGEDEGEDSGYDLPSYAASINESEIPTDIER